MQAPWLIKMAQLLKTKCSDSAKGDKKNNAVKAAQKLSISILVISLPLLYVSLLHVPPSNLFHDTTFWFLMSNSIIIIIATDSGFLFSPSTESSNLVYDEYVKRSKARSTSLPTSSIVAEPQILAVDSNNSLEDEANEEKVTEGPTSDEPPLALTQVVEERISRKEEEEEEVVHEVDCPRSDENYVQEPLALVIEHNENSLSHRQAPARSRSEMGMSGRTVRETERILRRSATEMKDRGGGGEASEYTNMSDEELNKRVEEFIRRFKEISLKELRNV